MRASLEEVARRVVEEASRRPLKLTRRKAERIANARVASTRELVDAVLRVAAQSDKVAVLVESRRGDPRRVILFPRSLGSPALDPEGWVG